eukprot:2742952-Amphidinium_carterae.4
MTLLAWSNEEQWRNSSMHTTVDNLKPNQSTRAYSTRTNYYSARATRPHKSSDGGDNTCQQELAHYVSKCDEQERGRKALFHKSSAQCSMQASCPAHFLIHYPAEDTQGYMREREQAREC